MVWQNDDDVTNCNGCKSEFGFFLRKHHCRRCGRVRRCVLETVPMSYSAVQTAVPWKRDPSSHCLPCEPPAFSVAEQVFCDDCSPQQAFLPSVGQRARVCKRCYREVERTSDQEPAGPPQ